MLCSAQRAEPKIATASAFADPSLRGKASTSYFYSFLQFVRSFSPSVSQPASLPFSLPWSFFRPSGRPSAQVSAAPEASPALSLSLSLSHPKLHVQFHLQDETLTRGILPSRVANRSRKSLKFQLTVQLRTTEGGRGRTDAFCSLSLSRAASAV